MPYSESALPSPFRGRSIIICASGLAISRIARTTHTILTAIRVTPAVGLHCRVRELEVENARRLLVGSCWLRISVCESGSILLPQIEAFLRTSFRALRAAIDRIWFPPCLFRRHPQFLHNGLKRFGLSSTIVRPRGTINMAQNAYPASRAFGTMINICSHVGQAG